MHLFDVFLCCFASLSASAPFTIPMASLSASTPLIADLADNGHTNATDADIQACQHQITSL